MDEVLEAADKLAEAVEGSLFGRLAREGHECECGCVSIRNTLAEYCRVRAAAPRDES